VPILEDQWVWRNREPPGWTFALQMLMIGPDRTRVDRYLLASRRAMKCVNWFSK
jgi:hypothetical protein